MIDNFLYVCIFCSDSLVIPVHNFSRIHHLYLPTLVKVYTPKVKPVPRNSLTFPPISFHSSTFQDTMLAATHLQPSPSLSPEPHNNDRQGFWELWFWWWSPFSLRTKVERPVNPSWFCRGAQQLSRQLLTFILPLCSIRAIWTWPTQWTSDHSL